jgi:glycosyltransferase involved in cell wall biosynthesis
LDLILRAAARLADQQQPVNVLFIGGGPEQANLDHLASELGLADRVHFYGPCHREAELAPLISLADLCVSPGHIGLTAMHALVYGTPVLTHDDPQRHAPEAEAIIPGLNGDFFARDDLNDLTAKIAAWLARPETAATTAAACQEVIAKYYNPHFQVKVINAAVADSPATSLPRGEEYWG